MASILTPTGLPVPILSDPANIPSDMYKLAEALDARTIPHYASTADRDSSWPASLAPAGSLCYIESTGFVYQVVGGAWVSQISVERIRALSSAAASLASTTHPLQVGPSNGTNLAFDGTGVMARSNGAESPFSFHNTRVTGVDNPDLTQPSDVVPLGFLDQRVPSPSFNPTVQGGWAAMAGIRWTRAGRIVCVAFQLERTAGAFTMVAWTAFATLLTGLPAPAFGTMRLGLLDHNVSADGGAFDAVMTAEGDLQCRARWASKTVDTGSWFAGSFAYPTSPNGMI